MRRGTGGGSTGIRKTLQPTGTGSPATGSVDRGRLPHRAWHRRPARDLRPLHRRAGECSGRKHHWRPRHPEAKRDSGDEDDTGNEPAAWSGWSKARRPVGWSA